MSAIVASCVLFSLAFLRPADLVAQTPKTPQRTIQVRVVDPDGKPVPATKIHAGIWTNEPSFKHNRDYVCDSDGQAMVELPRTLYILRLWADKDGYVPLFAHWEQEELNSDKNAIPKQFTFHLPKGTTIGGVVKDEDGNRLRRRSA